jgi:hypothetical protein
MNFINKKNPKKGGGSYLGTVKIHLLTLISMDKISNLSGHVFFSQKSNIQCCCSGIPDPGSGRCFFEPLILDPGWVKILKIRIQDEHLGSYFRELRNNFLS